MPSSKKKSEKIMREPINSDEITSESVDKNIIREPVKKIDKFAKKNGKYKIGSIVYVSKDADADLNGFKLFPQYKKYTYIVDAYDADTGVYTIKRLNLSLRLKEALILAPEERAHDQINRRQF